MTVGKIVDLGQNNKVDAQTGLSWRELEMRERAIKLRLENASTERSLSKEWMRTEDFHQVISLLIEALEHIPGKAKSELGLSDHQTTGLRRMLDESRQVAAKSIK